MGDQVKVITAKFFRTTSGAEPVRKWLKELNKDDSHTIGEDIREAEFGWPIGMPLCRSIVGYKDLWEVRSQLTGGRIARVVFFVKNSKMVLLHGFIKKTQRIPQSDLDLADKRRREYERYG